MISDKSGMGGQNGITRSLPKPSMGQPASNKGSYQKWQFLIVPLLAACHMGIREVSVQ